MTVVPKCVVLDGLPECWVVDAQIKDLAYRELAKLWEDDEHKSERAVHSIVASAFTGLIRVRDLASMKDQSRLHPERRAAAETFTENGLLVEGRSAISSSIAYHTPGRHLEIIRSALMASLDPEAWKQLDLKPMGSAALSSCVIQLAHTEVPDFSTMLGSVQAQRQDLQQV